MKLIEQYVVNILLCAYKKTKPTGLWVTRYLHFSSPSVLMLKQPVKLFGLIFSLLNSETPPQEHGPALKLPEAWGCGSITEFHPI